MRLNYIVIPLLVLGIAVLGSSFTSIGIDSGWYSGIVKPDWTPRGSVIGAVWTIIYALAAISLLLVWNRGAHNRQFRHIIAAFILNAIIHLGWSYVFFVQNMIGFAVVVAIAMWLSVIELISTLWVVRKSAAVLLIPYAGWLMFAIILNYMIYRLN